MPRGSDAKAAAEELRERYGKGAGNAEDIIRSQAAASPPALARASLKPVDVEATADLDYDKIAKAAGIKGTVIDASVRGGDTVYVYVDEDGKRAHKGVLIEGKDSPDQEIPHLERIRKLAKQNEKAAKKRAGKEDDAKPTAAEEKEQKEAEEAARQLAKTSSLRAKARDPQKAEEAVEDSKD